MSGNDLITVLTWWIWILGLTALFLPLTTLLFRSFVDRGYIFAKTLGIILISYTSFLFGVLHILQFDRISLFAITSFPLIIYAILLSKKPGLTKNLKNYLKKISEHKKIFLLEEGLFLIGLLFLSYIRAFVPDIHGLEKYMDFGFINSIGRATYFPPKDMWLPPEPINYYYFGHLVTAVLTKLTGIPSYLSYNLMLATIFSLCLVSGFSLGGNLLAYLNGIKTFFSKRVLIAAVIAALLLTLGGNLHTIYTFFTPYENEKPVPPWQLEFSPNTYPNAYWYPNATRYIHNTIHEFPIYSWTVADLHGHVLDIPFVLLTIALLLTLFQQSAATKSKEKPYSLLGLIKIPTLSFYYLLLGFLLAVMYMTNAWDGIIYFLLSFFVIVLISIGRLTTERIKISLRGFQRFFATNGHQIKQAFISIIILGVSYFVFVQPFNFSFKPFVSGVGVLCAPQSLINATNKEITIVGGKEVTTEREYGKIGPLLFEPNHCQHSLWWQLLILYGFFYFFIVSFLIFLFRKNAAKRSDYFVLILIFVSSLLILIPEFIYAKDIYPAHYRANTMFKLAFQAFMMLSICSAYIFVRVLGYIKDNFQNFSIAKKIAFLLYGGVTLVLMVIVMIYPYIALTSYYGDLKNYQGIDGTKYLKNLRPSDYELITWINKNISGQPIILEAQGDSYTDYARISSNTGLPTVLGWTVHEWLWRGSYDIPSPRIEEITTMYEENDIPTTKTLLEKYDVAYVVIGDLEREKYPNINEKKFTSLGKVIYQNGETRLYKLY